MIERMCGSTVLALSTYGGEIEHTRGDRRDHVEKMVPHSRITWNRKVV